MSNNYRSYAEWAQEDPLSFSQEWARALDTLQQQQYQQQQYQQLQQQYLQYAQDVQKRSQEYAKKNPEFAKRVNHMRSEAKRSLKRQYPKATDEQIQQHLGQLEIQEALQAEQQGKDLFGHFEEMADRQFNYKPEPREERFVRREEREESFDDTRESFFGMVDEAKAEKFGTTPSYSRRAYEADDDSAADDRWGTKEVDSADDGGDPIMELMEGR